jgi:GrpB-like predicted nucleotidyltransferase (UPF0157 family)/predicted phosphodiesterase
VRIAVLADIHGNLPALRAVLGDIDRSPVDAIVIAGDVVGGASVRECLELLAERREEVRWVAGNAERETVAVYDGEPPSDDPAGTAAAWSARALDDRWRDRLASWPISLALDGVRFCHGSPRRDDEILTRLTPIATLSEALADTAEALVVGGHTHQQLVRELPGGHTYANAGSVGMPYEGRAGAFWMIVEHGVPVACETSYDLDAATAELRSAGFPGLDDQLGESLLRPADPVWVAAFFEHGAGRGADPGPPREPGPIVLHDYDPAWPRRYEREATQLADALGGRALRLEHVGSTSVPGLPAKPIIDIVLEVVDSADEAAYAPDLEAAGYVLRIREPEWFEHRLFRPSDGSVNLHVFSAGCSEIDRMVRFRDHLRGEEADRDLYFRTKRELAARDWNYVQQYADAKTAVIDDILTRSTG